MTARDAPGLTPRKALSRLQSIGYALEELSILSETATAKELTSTLYVLSQVVEESTTAVQPLVLKHPPRKIDREA